LWHDCNIHIIKPVRTGGSSYAVRQRDPRRKVTLFVWLKARNNKNRHTFSRFDEDTAWAGIKTLLVGQCHARPARHPRANLYQPTYYFRFLS